MIRIQFALYTTSPKERQEPSKNQLIKKSRELMYLTCNRRMKLMRQMNIPAHHHILD